MKVQTSMFAAVAALCVATASMTSFAEAKQATLAVAGYTGSETLTGFQVLVKLSDNDAYGFKYAEAGGSAHNIWFTSVDGNQVYPHDIDTWNTSGDSFVWVRLPELEKGTIFTMHWSDNANDVLPASGNTWDGFVGVWHMNKSGTTSEPDSTGHGLAAKPVSTNDSSVSFNTEASIVGAGRANTYGGSNDGRYFSVGSNENPYHSHITTASKFSVSGWCKMNSMFSGSASVRIFCGLNKSNLYSWEAYRESATKVSMRSGDGSGHNYTNAYEIAIANGGGDRHYLTFVWDGDKATAYDNGAGKGTYTLRENTHPNNVFTIGGRIGTPKRSFVGTFDEVRMFDGAMTADRVAADYATMNDPTAFLVPCNPKQATLNATGYMGSDLADFQALVKLSASNDAYGFSYADCFASDGSDLWFTDAEGSLIPHDIDTWNTSGDSFVWVKIPTLANGTEIVMHWGAPRTAAQTCTPSDTWSNFVGVWHMNGTGTAAETNKTANVGLNAFPTNSASKAVSFNRDLGGKVGSARKNNYQYDGRYFSVGSSSNPYHTAITEKSRFSVSGWCRLDVATNSYQRIFCGLNASSLNSWEAYRQNTKVSMRSGNGSAQTLKEQGWDINLQSGCDDWHYLTFVWDGDKATAYDNNADKGTQTLRANTHPNNVFTIGGRLGTGNRSFIGTFDEVRMFNGAMTADRVAADYATMTDPTTFLTFKPADTTVVRAEWSGEAGDGDVTNPANWNCYTASGTKVDGLPENVTDVVVSGNNLKFQVPIGTTLACNSFVLSNATLAADCDLRGLGDVTVADNTVIDLNDYALFVRGLAGNGVITNKANGTYATLDYVSTGAGQYIITDYTPTGNDVVSMHVNFNTSSNQSLWCSRENSKTNMFACITTAAGKLRFDRYTTTKSTIDVATNVDYEIIANYATGDCKVNGTNVCNMGTSSYTPEYKLALFRLRNGESTGGATTAYETTDYKLFHFRICGADGTPKLDLVPAYKRPNYNTPGLWDRVSGTFYTASGAVLNAGTVTRRGEVVFYVPSGVTATRSGVTIAVEVKVTKEGAGTLAEAKLGHDMTKAGDYSLRDGTVSFGPSTGDYLDLGPTNFCISGGTFSPSGAFNLQVGRERTGRFAQNGGTVSMSSYHVLVGIRASAEYDLTGGELGVNLCYLGYGNNAVGTMRVSGGKVNAADFRIGANGTGHGDVLQNGGEVTTTTLSLPAASTATGAYDFSGGTLTINNALVGGNNGRGSFFQSGGSCTVKGYPWIGADANSVGLYEMTGGTLTASSQPVSVGRFGTGTLNVSGSAVVTASHGVRVGLTHTDGTGSGTLVVTNGGTIATTSIYGGGTTPEQAKVVFNNATVEATAAGDILKDLHDVMIGTSGLTISNNFAVTVNNTKLKVAPGVTAITKTGTGTLDFANATVELSSVPTAKFTFAEATGTGTFVGVPAVTVDGGASLGKFKCRLSKDGKRIEITDKPTGVMVLVF